MTEEINPDELMPLPDRLKKEEIVIESGDVGKMEDLIPSLIKPEEPVEAPQKPPEPKIEASKIKEAEVVEPVSTKANLYRR